MPKTLTFATEIKINDHLQMNQKRAVNAAPGQDPNDLVVKSQARAVFAMDILAGVDFPLDVTNNFLTIPELVGATLFGPYIVFGNMPIMIGGDAYAPTFDSDTGTFDFTNMGGMAPGARIQILYYK